MVLLYIFLWREIVQEKLQSFFQAIADIMFFIAGHIFPTADSDFYLVTMINILAIIIFYSYAKICGLFKRLKGLNFFSSLLIIIFVDIILFYSICINVQLKPLKFSYMNLNILKDGYFFPTTIMFFIYKYFDLMAKYCPESFGKIGYYTSIEFYREIGLKFKNNFRWY